MGITEKQRAKRDKHLGSSDLYDVIFGNAYKVWCSKVYPQKPLEADYLQAGNYLERALLAFAEDQLGPITRNQYRRVEGFPIGCNIDAIVNESGNPVEGKAALNFITSREWGEPGTDEIPARAIVQCHGHMLATDTKVCHVPALVMSGAARFAMFQVEFDESLGDVICDRAQDFWDTFVLPRREPDDSWSVSTAPDLKELKRVIHQSGELAQCNDETLLDRFLKAKELLAFCKAGTEELEARIRAAMGEAETVEFPSGRRFHLKPIKGTKLDRKAIEQDHPGLLKKYTNPNPYARAVVLDPPEEGPERLMRS